MQTRDVRIDGDLVTKRSGAGKQGGADREWRALVLLAKFAPGFAPLPVKYSTDEIAGTPIALLPAVPEQQIVEAVDRLPRRCRGRCWT
ncbi:hypothetical protein [Herbidospora cretacea]|uniref:hypothetical protein n=1 Tax=Herbidospora cretacea TaxID=28444 RepID=UPI0012DCCB10|nr:hypothetical protein [Herbidospora cretacea]